MQTKTENNSTHYNEQTARLVYDFKGLDPDIFLALPPHKQTRFYELTKVELLILAESARSGASQALAAVISTIENGAEYTTDVQDTISALLEFGQTYDDLCLTDKETAQKHEIRDEFGHFSRIMGLDSVLEDTSEEQAIDVDTAYRQCKDFHRFLMALNERGVDRNYTEEYLPVHAESNTEGKREAQYNYVATYKNKHDNIAAIVFANQTNDHTQTETLKELADVYERFLTHYPFEVSNLLMDYYAYLRNVPAGIGFVAAQEYVKEGIRFAKTALLGNATILQLSPKNDQDPFRKNVASVITPDDTTASLGGNTATPFQVTRFEVGQRDTILLIPAPLAHLYHDTDELDAIINKEGTTGKILPTNNLQDLLAENKTKSGVIVMRVGRVQEQHPIQWEEQLPKSGLAESDVVHQLATTHQKMNIETAHVHADRNEGLAQRAGVLIANYLIDQVKTFNPALEIERTAMIDEYHVINRINYNSYYQMLEELNYPLDELTLESSPVVKALSHDILKYVLKHHAETDLYSILEKGNNIYLTYDNGRKVIELIEDAPGKFVSGCILFDIALTMYKRRPEILQKLYMQRNPVKRFEGINSDSENLHELMVEIYRHESSPAKRDAMVAELIQEKPVNYETLKNTLDDTPFLDAISHVKDENDVAVVNVLEEFYRPQQGKHNRFLSFLGFPLLYTLYFNGSTGNVYLEQTLI